MQIRSVCVCVSMQESDSESDEEDSTAVGGEPEEPQTPPSGTVMPTALSAWSALPIQRVRRPSAHAWLQMTLLTESVPLSLPSHCLTPTYTSPSMPRREEEAAYAHACTHSLPPSV